ncbi:MAG: hypothetical protein JXB07_10090 [Anaerolineae bacterium]|nr:hypothetical protein [Anaerolineae bacterium]
MLFSFVVAGWVGAIIGQVVGDVMDVHILMVGTTNLLTCVLGACLAIGLMVLLFWQRVPHRAHRRLD